VQLINLHLIDDREQGAAVIQSGYGFRARSDWTEGLVSLAYVVKRDTAFVSHVSVVSRAGPYDV
jgi:hypothetical protein